ncbi:MAG: DNA repair exonuclease [Myxococcota bacterium]
MRLLHTADLHIDSPLRGLSRHEGAPVARIRGATRAAFQNVVDVALEERVDAVLVAGDVFDGDWRDYSTGLFFVAELQRLRDAAIPVFLLRGNHDAASQVSRHLELPAGCHLFSSDAPHTIVDERLGLAVHGQSFAKRVVTDDLAAAYPSALDGFFNVGLLHTALTGRVGHAPYAPTRVETLRAKGYEYWALGHVHQREIVADDPPIVFPGNPQGRHINEPGPRGVTLVDVSDNRVVGLSERITDVVRFAHLRIDASLCPFAEDVIDRAYEALRNATEEAGDRLVCCRITIEGPTEAHAALYADPLHWESQLRAAAFGLDEVWIERVRFRTEARVDRKSLAQRDDALGQLLRSLDALRENNEDLESLGAEFRELEKRLPAQLRSELGTGLHHADYLRERLSEVEGTLLPRLLAMGDESGALE